MALILVVDDNPDACKLLARLLSQYGHQTSCAYSAPEALQMLGTLRPDLILLDQMMPDMSGVDMLKIVRADERFAMTPVVMLTALHDLQTRAHAAAAGASDFWTKPINIGELRQQVARLLGPRGSPAH